MRNIKKLKRMNSEDPKGQENTGRFYLNSIWRTWKKNYWTFLNIYYYKLSLKREIKSALVNADLRRALILEMSQAVHLLSQYLPVNRRQVFLSTLVTAIYYHAAASSKPLRNMCFSQRPSTLFSHEAFH